MLEPVAQHDLNSQKGAKALLKGTLQTVVAGFVMLGLSNSIAAARDVIDRNNSRFKDYPIGAIVVDTSERKLYYMMENGKALRYRVAVGKPKMQWFGRTFVTLKRKNPGWTPTPRMRRMGYPAYVPPGPKNPLGVRAIYLGWTEYRIHGTTSPRSIGRAASSGCIRMLNKDVVDLYKRVHIGAPVDVIR